MSFCNFHVSTKLLLRCLLISLCVVCWRKLGEVFAADSRSSMSGLSSTSSSSPEDPLQHLDQFVIELLHANLSLDDFEARMQLYAQSTNKQFTKGNIYDVYIAHRALHNFDAPCNMDNLFVFSVIEARIAKFSSLELLQVIASILRDNCIERYANKCLDEFDEFARHLLSQDQDMQQLVNVLPPMISEQARREMTYELLERDLDFTRQENGLLISVTVSMQIAAPCTKINLNPNVAHVLKMFQLSLQEASGLRRASATRLNEQFHIQQPNALKLLSLALFCDSLVR